MAAFSLLVLVSKYSHVLRCDLMFYCPYFSVIILYVASIKYTTKYVAPCVLTSIRLFRG